VNYLLSIYLISISNIYKVECASVRLLGDGGLLLCSGGVFFWSVLGLFLGNDLFIGTDNNGGGEPYVPL
jgi:hypothetical protein